MTDFNSYHEPVWGEPAGNVSAVPGTWEKKYYELKKWYNGSVKEAQKLLDENLALKDRIVEYFLEGK